MGLKKINSVPCLKYNSEQMDVDMVQGTFTVIVTLNMPLSNKIKRQCMNCALKTVRNQIQ